MERPETNTNISVRRDAKDKIKEISKAKQTSVAFLISTMIDLEYDKFKKSQLLNRNLLDNYEDYLI